MLEIEGEYLEHGIRELSEVLVEHEIPDLSSYGTKTPPLPPGSKVGPDAFLHRPSASPMTSGGSGHSSVSQMARSSSASRTVTCWFARIQAAQATTIRCLMSGTD